MKKFFSTLIFFSFGIIAFAQGNKADIIQGPDQNKPVDQNTIITATLKSSSRLFRVKDDLTSVILVIPAGSTVTVLGSDTTYLHVTYEENEGYLYRRHAVIDKSPVVSTQITSPQPQVQKDQPMQAKQSDRFTYLENKYGAQLAARLNAGKIWKGMSTEMVKDSWGNAEKINSNYNGTIPKERWIFKNSWLYFENNILIQWGPVEK